MSNLQLLWISPDGVIRQVPDHKSYADSITKTHPGEVDYYLSIEKMFRNGWIRGVREDNILYLNNSLKKYLKDLNELSEKQFISISNYSKRNNLTIMNTMRDILNEQSPNQVASPENFKKRLGSLYLYMAKRLGIKNPPAKVVLTKSKKNQDRGIVGLTGYYDHKNKIIRIYTLGRSDSDLLRSSAHEIIHHWQNERGTLHPRTEQENNDTVPHYAQNDPWLRKREMEAFLLGSLLYRDFLDELRYGPPSKEPLLPQPYD